MIKWKTQRKLFKVEVIEGNIFQKAIHINQAKKLQSKQTCYSDVTILGSVWDLIILLKMK